MTRNFFNFEHEIKQMMDEHPGNSSDRHTKILAKTDSYRLLLVSLTKNTHIREHQVEGRVFIQTLKGEIHVGNGDESVKLPKGCLTTLAPMQKHDVFATQDSVFLLTITQLNS
ncbi:MAG: hypothetical protein R2877_08155 [Bdellovibrionota bacterium]